MFPKILLDILIEVLKKIDQLMIYKIELAKKELEKKTNERKTK